MPAIGVKFNQSCVVFSIPRDRTASDTAP